MRTRTPQLTNTVFIIAALFLLVLSFLSYQRMNKQVQASDLVSKTQLLKFKLNDAFSHLIKTESAQRGFILTKDSSFLSDYFQAKQQIPALLSQARALVTNSPQQTHNLALAESLFLKRLNYLHNTLMANEKISLAVFDSMLIRGEHISDELSVRIEDMIATEDSFLAQRTVTKQKEGRNASLFIFLFSLLSISILLLGFFRVKKEMFTNNILEQKVAERTEEIKSANEILNEQNLQLKRKNDELSSFTFVANHDLKEPLRKIELFTSRLAMDDSISVENKKLVAKTIECVRRMKDLLEDIFIYTLTDKVAGFEPTDLNKVAETSIEKLQEIIKEKQAIIEYGNLPTINAIPQNMEQLFTNLLTNSLKYCKKDVSPCITIEAEKQDAMQPEASWKIKFSDNGIGFNEEYKERIFEMFQRLHLKHQYEGTGMGLTICKKIVENHRGTITASSARGQGAVFTILLPEMQNQV